MAPTGVPEYKKELLEMGTVVNKKRIERLMRLARIQGVSRRRRFVVSTQRDRAAKAASDLVKRKFIAKGINQLWVADMTYVPTWAGVLYLAVVVDVYSRKVVGWAFGENMASDWVIAALNMALHTRRPESVIHHSDQGSQYTSLAFGKRCEEMGVKPSMGAVGDAYDNAMAESFFATLECELINRRSWKTKGEARLAIFTWIESWYNPLRRHSGIGLVSPNNFERNLSKQTTKPNMIEIEDSNTEPQTVR
jgi:putative transposase